MPTPPPHARIVTPGRVHRSAQREHASTLAAPGQPEHRRRASDRPHGVVIDAYRRGWRWGLVCGLIAGSLLGGAGWGLWLTGVLS